MKPRDEHEEVKLKLVRQWIDKAEQDLKAAETLLHGDPPLFYPSCFHSQQAAEKYTKGFLTWHQVEFPKTHDFNELLDLVGRVDKDLAKRLEDIALLNPYGVEVRYPGDMPEPTLPEAKSALDLARKARNAILPFLRDKTGCLVE